MTTVNFTVNLAGVFVIRTANFAIFISICLCKTSNVRFFYWFEIVAGFIIQVLKTISDSDYRTKLLTFFYMACKDLSKFTGGGQNDPELKYYV